MNSEVPARAPSPVLGCLSDLIYSHCSLAQFQWHWPPGGSLMSKRAPWGPHVLRPRPGVLFLLMPTCIFPCSKPISWKAPFHEVPLLLPCCKWKPCCPDRLPCLDLPADNPWYVGTCVCACTVPSLDRVPDAQRVPGTQSVLKTIFAELMN